MGKIAKILGIGIAALLLLIGGWVTWVLATYDIDHADVPLPAIQASTDPAVVARGEYVVHALAHCSACHGPAEKVERRELDFAAPLVGGYAWDIPLFGRFVAANITPDPETGIGALSDGQLARAIRSGVGRDGKLIPFMSFAVGPMSDEDLTAVVSWLRAQPAVARAQPGDELGFAAKALADNFQPRRDPPPADVAPGAIDVARGRYLAEGPAACKGCHSPYDMMTFEPIGPAFSGSAAPEPDPTDGAYAFVTPNLTPDPETGHIATWSEDAFVQRMRAGRMYPGSKMPWENFARMTDADLRSIHRFLGTLPPTANAVGPIRRPS